MFSGAKLLYKSLCPSVSPSVANHFWKFPPIITKFGRHMQNWILRTFYSWVFFYLSLRSQVMCERFKAWRNFWKFPSIIMKFGRHMQNWILRTLYSWVFFDLSLRSQVIVCERFKAWRNKWLFIYAPALCMYTRIV